MPHTLIGKPYDKDVAVNAKNALANTGWYADVQLTTEPMEGGVRLVFTVTENPLVLQVAVTGLVHLTAEQQQSVLATAQSLQNLPVNNNAETMGAEKMRDLGWFRQWKCTRAAFPGGESLLFSVTEMPVIAGVTFTGNTRFTASEISRMACIPIGEVLNRNEIRDAGMNIEKLYSLFGYTQSRVIDYHLTDENKLVFTIFEPIIGQIIIVGNSKTPAATIFNALTFHVGDVYNVDAIQESLKQLDALGLFWDISSVPEPGATPGTLRETVRVEER